MLSSRYIYPQLLSGVIALLSLSTANAQPTNAQGKTQAAPRILEHQDLQRREAEPTPRPIDPSAVKAVPPAARPTGDQTATEPKIEKGKKAHAVVERLTAITATMVLKVVHPEEVRRAAIEKVQSLHGHASLVTNTELYLRVPPEHLNAILESLLASGTALDKSLQRVDRTEYIAQLEAKLKSKREIFQRLRTFIDDSNVQATLKIERSMTALVAELEALKGDLEVERASVELATLQVNFQFHQQDRIAYVKSPFEWLNSVDLARFLAEF